MSRVPAPIEMPDREREAYRKASDPFVLKGDYTGALAILKPYLKRYSDDFYLRYQYAKLIGDWADELPPARQKKFKKQAVAILRPLMKQLKGKPVDLQFGLSVNYYYQSEDWAGMYDFGKRFSRLDAQRGLYARGMAAALLAYDLRSKTWARRSIKAWSAYDLAHERYYFPHYCYAKALAVAGELNEAMRRLKKAASLAKRPVTDWEFADVVKICSSASS